MALLIVVTCNASFVKQGWRLSDGILTNFLSIATGASGPHHHDSHAENTDRLLSLQIAPLILIFLNKTLAHRQWLALSGVEGAMVQLRMVTYTFEFFHSSDLASAVVAPDLYCNFNRPNHHRVLLSGRHTTAGCASALAHIRASR